jgi:hypothetical protein
VWEWRQRAGSIYRGQENVMLSPPSRILASCHTTNHRACQRRCRNRTVLRGAG